MNKILIFLGASIGGWIGWFIGAYVGTFTAFVISMIGTGVGMYAANRFVREYMP